MNDRHRHMFHPRRALIPQMIPLIILLAFFFFPSPVSLGAANGQKLQRTAKRALRAGDFEAAEGYFRELLVQDPRDHQARLGLSYTLMKRGLMDDAFRQAAMVASQEPLNARAHALMGFTLLRSGIFHRSQEEFATALMLDENDAAALAGMAEIDLFENRTKQAYEKLRKATSRDPNEPDYWIAIGRAAARLERFREAAQHYDRYLSVAPRLNAERRALYRGLIDFYNALSRNNVTSLHRVEGAKSAVIPIRIQNSRPFVRLKLNGGDRLWFVVDTGASITVLSERAAKRLKIPVMARGGRARAFGGTGKFNVVYGLVNEIAIDNIKIYNSPVYIREFQHFRIHAGDGRLQPDGFLGLSALSNFRLTLDYGNRQLILERPSLPRPDEELSIKVTSVPFRSTNGGLVSVEARLDDSQVHNFLIDSAASAMVVSDDMVKKLDWQDKLLSLKARVLGAAGIIEQVDLMLVPSLVISDLELRNIRSPVLDMDLVNESAGFYQSGIIGGHFLKHFRITFDFKKFRVSFVPQTEAIRRIAPEPVPLVKEKVSGEN